MYIHTNSNGDEIHEDDCPLNGKHAPTTIYRKDGSIDRYDHDTNELISHKDPPPPIDINEWCRERLRKYLEIERLSKRLSSKDTTTYK